MKRYRVLNIDFDARVNTLKIEIKDDWEFKTRRNWIENKQRLIQGLVSEYGELYFSAKLLNFIDIGIKPFSIIAFHNKFFEQARQAFIVGAYYPALTSVCALGERILNHLILKLRDHFIDSPEYKRIYRKDSFDDWDTAIDVLSKWDILLPNTIAGFQKLKGIRNDNIHFNYSTDYNDRDFALVAIKEMSTIISEQFTAFGEKPWFIPHTKGACFIKKECENKPFIKEIYLPNCEYVGPKYKIDFVDHRPVVHDDEDYGEAEISDEEFVRLLENK